MDVLCAWFSQVRLFQALPLAFRDDCVEAEYDGGNGFEVFAEGAGDFGRRMIVAESAAEFEGRSVGAC